MTVLRRQRVSKRGVLLPREQLAVAQERSQCHGAQAQGTFAEEVPARLQQKIVARIHDGLILL